MSSGLMTPFLNMVAWAKRRKCSQKPAAHADNGKPLQFSRLYQGGGLKGFIKRTDMRSDKKIKLVGYCLVTLQFLAIIMCCFPFSLADKKFVSGFLLTATGAVAGMTTIYFNRPGNFNIYPEIKSNARLIINGPYKYIRHPMYTSLLIMMSGLAIYNSHFLNFMGLAVLALVLATKSHIEEILLRNHFPAYSEYMQRTKKFIPFIF